jgi:cytochrome c-type biogenesis protein
MSFGIGTYGIALVAGLLTTLSPCVLPLIPLLMGSAVSAHRLAPWALAVGVALSFTAAGVLLASVGASLGLDGETFRGVAALLMTAFGIILLSGRLQALFVRATSGLTNSGHALLTRFTLDGLGGSSYSDSCSALSGAPASGRRSAPPRRSRAKAGISHKSRC